MQTSLIPSNLDERRLVKRVNTGFGGHRGWAGMQTSATRSGKAPGVEDHTAERALWCSLQPRLWRSPGQEDAAELPRES